MSGPIGAQSSSNSNTELVQFRAPWSRPETTPTPAPRPPSPAREEPATDGSSSGASEYVLPGDLARQLRKIDPAAKVEWDGRALRIEANGHKFTIFQGREMVVNGVGEKTNQALRIRGEEIYVPQSVVDRIGTELGKPTAGASPSPSPTTSTLAAVSPTPIPTVPPVATVLPEVPEPTVVAAASPTISVTVSEAATPAVATPTASAIATPTPAQTVVTPIPTAPPAPIATATPFPVATATPSPTASPAPRTPTPVPVVEIVTPAASRTRRTPKPSKPTPSIKAPSVATLDASDAVRLALKDKAELEQYKIPARRKAELESLAANPQITRVVIHPDDSDFDSMSPFGKQGAAICLEIAQRLQTQLKAKGIDSVLTRSGAQRVPLGKKLEIINNSGAQVLIIISVGQNEDFTDMAGYRILYATDSVDYTAVKSGNVEGGDLVPMELNYRSFQAQNKILASALLEPMKKAVDRDPVGLNPAPLYLAKRSPMASAEVVVGYLTNPADAKRLTDKDGQDKVAAAIMDGISDYSSHIRQPGAVK